MKLARPMARVTICSAVLAAALAAAIVPRPAQAGSPPPRCAQPLFAPAPLTPHFTIPSAGPWAGYRGAAIEQDWPEARRQLTGPHQRSFRPLRSLLAWLESLLMPRSHGSAVCLHCQAQPIDFELGYDALPTDEPYYRDEPSVLQTPAPPRSPEFNPMPVPEPSPMAPTPMPRLPVDPSPLAPVPAEVAPTPEPEPPQRLTPPPVIELAPELVLPMDPPVPARPPRNTIPKPAPKPPKNLVPRYSK